MAVLKNLLTDAIFEQDFMELHQSVTTHLGGIKPALYVGALQLIKPTSIP